MSSISNFVESLLLGDGPTTSVESLLLGDDPTFAVVGQTEFDSAPPTRNGTLQELADYLRTGYWASTGRAARSWAGGNVSVNLTDLTAAEANLARSAMALWQSVANINFTETTGTAQIRFINDGSGVANTSSTTSGSNLVSATIQISSDWWPNTNFNQYMYQTYIHEIGHAIGLGHQGPYNNTATYPNDANWFNDSWRLSIMSYFDQSEAGTGSYAYVTGPQMADIRAIQDIYGARTTRTGNDIYGYNGSAGTSYNLSALGSDVSFTIYDSGGTDTLDGSGYSGSQTLDLRPGEHSSIGGETNNIGIWVNTIVENAIGGNGADTFRGNTASNILTGGGGLDTVIFDGNLNQFSFTESNSYLVTGASQGTDVLNSIERFVFNDTTVIDDAVGGTATNRSIAAGNSLSGSIQFLGDRDWFSTSLTSGHRYVIDLRGSATGSGTLSDPLLRLYNGSGVELTSNDDGGFGLESQIAINVGNGGTFFAGAGAFADSVLSGTYTLSLQDVGGSGRFEASEDALAQFTPGAGGWSSQDRFPRRLADVNGDRRADIVGFGQDGVYVALATGDGGFSSLTQELAQFGAGSGAGGWGSDDRFPRHLADVNGDGQADIVGFGQDGVYVALATGSGHFGPLTQELAQFGAGSGAGGWGSDDRFPRHLADVNGDGQADIVGFGQDGVYVALATGSGHFGPLTQELAQFGAGSGAGGWGSDDRFPRHLADVNGDGRADIVGFGEDGIYVSLATGGGDFGSLTFEISAFAPNAGGWSSNDLFLRAVADITGDGTADIVGFGYSGIQSSPSHNFISV